MNKFISISYIILLINFNFVLIARRRWYTGFDIILLLLLVRAGVFKLIISATLKILFLLFYSGLEKLNIVLKNRLLLNPF